MIRRISTGCLLAMMANVMALPAALADDNTGDRITDTDQLFQTLDTDRDGQIREAEIDPQHEQLFLRLLKYADADEDGALNAEEWAKGLKPPNVNRPLEKLPDPVSEEEKPSAVFARLDQNNNGELDRSEMPEALQEKWERVMKIADKNGDGAVKRREFMRSYPALARQGLREIDQKRENALAMFARWDSNGDGKVTLNEVPPKRRDKLEIRFAVADSNSDGALDKQELQAAFAAPELAMNALTPAGDAMQSEPKKDSAKNREAGNLQERARQLDVDGDRLLSREEARGPLAKHFERIDVDANGSLNDEELRRAANVIAKWRKRRRKPQ